MTHVVWDWNGTLFDDLELTLESLGAALHGSGSLPVPLDRYQAVFARPVIRIYEGLLERDIDADELIELDTRFHRHYESHLDAVRLAPDATAAVDLVEAAGATQSVLSLWWHDRLVDAAHRTGLAGRMVRIDGNRGSSDRGDGNTTKQRHLEHHLANLDGIALPLVLIGDSLDDAAAATSLGTRCVLYDGGSHARRALLDHGAPVAASLLEAARLATGSR